VEKWGLQKFHPNEGEGVASIGFQMNQAHLIIIQIWPKKLRVGQKARNLRFFEPKSLTLEILG
jgi:hypothetical protein